MVLVSPGSIMCENARKAGAHAENEQLCAPPPLSRPSPLPVSMHLFFPFIRLLPATAFPCSLPFPPHFNSGRGRPVLGSEDRQQKIPATQVQAFCSTDQVHRLSPEVSVNEEGNRNPRYCTCVSIPGTAQALHHMKL